MGLLDNNSKLDKLSKPGKTPSALQGKTSPFQQGTPNITYYESKIQFRSTNPAIANTLLYYPVGNYTTPSPSSPAAGPVEVGKYLLTEISDYILTEDSNYLITEQ